MKAIYFLLALLSVTCFAQNKPQPFLEEIVSQFPNVRDLAISPNGHEVMFTAQSFMGNLSAIVTVAKEGDSWGLPKVASFSGKYFDLEPFYSPDGLKLYFVSTRPMDQTSVEPKDFDIWVVERKNLNSAWSKPKNMGSPINTEHGEFYPSIAKNGNFYFTRDNPTLNRKDDLYISLIKEGKYQEPFALPKSINTESYEYNAFIAPDESYLIFGGYNRKDGLGSGDLYISYKTENGWSEAKNMGNFINSDKMDYCPFVKDGILYFTSKRDFTDTKPKNTLSFDDLLEEFWKYDNGSSKLYKIPFESMKH